MSFKWEGNETFTSLTIDWLSRYGGPMEVPMTVLKMCVLFAPAFH